MAEIKDYKDYGNNIAIIGASPDRTRMSNKAVRAFSDEGFKVFPIRPDGKSVEGIVSFKNLEAVGKTLDIASVYVSPERQDDDFAEQLGRAKVKLVIFNPGSENPRLHEKLWSYGMEVREECSIVGLGRSPEEFN